MRASFLGKQDVVETMRSRGGYRSLSTCIQVDKLTFTSKTSR
jgi:hypothetical protein